MTSKRNLPALAACIVALCLLPTGEPAGAECGEAPSACPSGAICGGGSGEHPQLDCEFASAFDTLTEAAGDSSRMWDVDLARRTDGRYDMVWEQYQGGGFHTAFSIRNPGPLGLECTTTNCAPCTLGRGGNPEVFDGYVVWHGNGTMPPGQVERRRNIYWIQASDIEAGACGPGASCQCATCLPGPTVDCLDAGGQPLNAARHVAGVDYGSHRKAAVTDGRVILWWECQGLCSKAETTVDLRGCVIPGTGHHPNLETCADPGGVFTVAGGPGAQRRPRVARADRTDGSRRSIVTYEDCAASTADCKVRIAELDLDVTELDDIVDTSMVVSSLSNSNWPDVEGDLIVWDQDVTGGSEIVGCQASRTSEGLDFTPCASIQNHFLLSAGAGGSQVRPAVWSSNNTVAWAEETACSSAPGGTPPPADLLVGRVQRDPSTEACAVKVDHGQAEVLSVRIRDLPDRRAAAPRVADSVVFWSDSRFANPAGACPGPEDAIAGLFSDDSSNWYQPAATYTCQSAGGTSGTVTVTLDNPLADAVKGRLIASAQCLATGPGGGTIGCIPSEPPLIDEQALLPPGLTHENLDFTCCDAVSQSQILVRVEFTPVCGNKKELLFESGSCN